MARPSKKRKPKTQSIYKPIAGARVHTRAEENKKALARRKAKKKVSRLRRKHGQAIASLSPPSDTGQLKKARKAHKKAKKKAAGKGVGPIPKGEYARSAGHPGYVKGSGKTARRIPRVAGERVRLDPTSPTGLRKMQPGGLQPTVPKRGKGSYKLRTVDETKKLALKRARAMGDYGPGTTKRKATKKKPVAKKPAAKKKTTKKKRGR